VRIDRPPLALALLLIACSTRATSRTATASRPIDPRGDRGIRVALVILAPPAMISGTSEFAWFEPGGRTLLARARRGEQWRLERESRGSRVRAVRPDGVPTAWQNDLVARAADGGFLTVNGKRYRGDLQVAPMDTSFVVVNRLSLEDYLRGVVAVEMGNRSSQDSAALQAQAVAARSYAVKRLDTRERPFDVRSSVADQAYGGLDAENERANAAVDATRGLVLLYEGRVVDAPYSSTCGGTTAEASEVWRAADAPYLQRVSDRVGLGDRYYCDIAPRYRWTRTLSATELNGALEQYLRAYAQVPVNGPGRARTLAIVNHTPSGRVGTLQIETDRGTFPLRGNDIRYVMRVPGGEILSSTYFSVEPEHGVGGDGQLERVTFRGQGNGHGIGMCQWGAIGRSRAGQSFRSILGTYYPGTTVGPVQ